MNPGVSQRNTSGTSNASHSCMKRAALSAASTSIAPPRWAGLLATTPIARPSTRASAVTIPSPHPRRSSSTEPASNNVVDDPADVVRAHAVLRHEVAQVPLVRALPVVALLLEVRQVLLGDGHRLDFVLDSDVDDAVRHLHAHRPDLGRRRRRRAPPPSIIAGPPIPMFEFAVAMITSQQPRIAALPAKQ